MKRKSIKFAVMTLYEANQQLLSGLYRVYDKREAANIADWVMESLTGLKKIDRIIRKTDLITSEKLALLEKYGEELQESKPVQYVLQEAWFYGLKFFVNEQVLIPRPETEELAAQIISEYHTQQPFIKEPPDGESTTAKILDVGTGSGCIAVSLKKHLPHARVFACDLSKGAITVAEKNALDHNTPISFIQLDFTDNNNWDRLPDVNILVSNPPYIPIAEKQSMHKNVMDYEPHLALFANDQDPLLFYKAIADFAGKKLLPDGTIFVETHEQLAQETADVFIRKGFAAVIQKDMQGKERMIRAVRP